MSPSNKVLLDTDIYSEILRGRNPIVVAQATSYRRLHGRLTISAPTVVEIVRGLQRVQAVSQIPRFVTSIRREEVIGIDLLAADWLAGSQVNSNDSVKRLA